MIRVGSVFFKVILGWVWSVYLNSKIFPGAFAHDTHIAINNNHCPPLMFVEGKLNRAIFVYSSVQSSLLSFLQQMMMYSSSRLMSTFLMAVLLIRYCTIINIYLGRHDCKSYHSLCMYHIQVMYGVYLVQLTHLQILPDCVYRCKRLIICIVGCYSLFIRTHASKNTNLCKLTKYSKIISIAYTHVLEPVNASNRVLIADVAC